MAISYVVRINGVDRADTHVLYEGFSINEVLDGINTLSCEVESSDASFRPLKRQTIEVDEVDGTSPARTIFGGLIKTVRERGFGQPADGIDDIVQNITADDYKVYAQRRFVTETIPAGTLKAALQVLEPYLTAYGVTLDPAQPTGPTLEAIQFDVVRVDDCLNFLTQLTTKYGDPFTWTISYTKLLGMYQTGTIPAPWDLIEGDGTEVGDIEVEPTDDEYANKIIVVFGSGKVITTSDTFATDGVTNSFPLTYRLVGPLPGVGYGAVGQAIVVFNGITATLAEIGLGYEWEYDPVTNSVSRTAGPPAAAGTLVVPYDGELKGVAIALDAGEIASVGLWEYKILAPEVEDPALAQSIADAELARRLSTGRIVRFVTRRVPGPVPGESITITVGKRNIAGVFTVTDVVTESEPGNVYDEDGSPPLAVEQGMLRRVTCDSSIHEQSHQTLTRWWSEKDTNGIALPAGSAGVPAPPLYSIQSNRPLGRFFGEGYLLYKELYFGGASPGINGLLFPANPGIWDDPHRMEMGMINGVDFSMDMFGAGDRGASPVVTPSSILMNSPGDIFITSGTGAPNPPVTSPPTEWYWGSIRLTGNSSLTEGYIAVGGFFAGGFEPGFRLIPGPYGDSVSVLSGFTLFDSIGLSYHPIDNIVATLPFTIDTSGVSDTQDFSTYISTAGTGTITLPPVGTTGTPNYHVWPVTGTGRVLLIANHSSGTLTVSGGGATINGAASIALGPYSSVVVHRFSDVATGKWDILSSHGSVTGGGGGGTALTIGGNDKDVQFNDGGVLGGEDAFEYVKTEDQLRLTASADQKTQLKIVGDDLGAVIGGHAGFGTGVYYGEITFGREWTAGVDTARRNSPAYLWAQDTGAATDGIGIEVNPGESQGSAMAYTLGRGFRISEDGIGYIYQYGGLGSGSPGVTGCGLEIDNNTDGSGAAAYLDLKDKNGVDRYIWCDASGNFRHGTAPPQEDGTPSDTSGSLFGAGINGDGSINVLTADPAAPADDTFWVRRTGTSPTRQLELRIRDNGTTHTLAAITV